MSPATAPSGTMLAALGLGTPANLAQADTGLATTTLGAGPAPAHLLTLTAPPPSSHTQACQRLGDTLRLSCVELPG